MSTDPASFGKHLKAWRRGLGLTQAQLGQRVGCSAITIRKLESGERWPSNQLATLLAQHLRLSEGTRSIFLNLARTPHSPSLFPVPMPATTIPTLPTLIGREQDVAALHDVLNEGRSRLITLTGPGGVGKTTLAKCVALQAATQYRHGMLWVDLTQLNSPAQVLPTIARTLGMTLTHDVGVTTTVQDRIIDYLSSKNILLVLDNLEHVLGAIPQIVNLIPACPKLMILATSRMALRNRLEKRVAIAPLSLDASERLFAACASTVRPNATFSAADHAAIRALCGHLDGLPLAIELAATRIAIMSPQRALDLFVADQKVVLPFIANDTADLPARQRTLQSTIQWSVDLLNREQQRVFRYLSVFAGGFNLDAATHVACLPTSSPHPEMTSEMQLAAWATLTALLEANLLSIRENTFRDGFATEPEFYMLETIHVAAKDALDKAEESNAARERHAQYFERLAQYDAETYERSYNTSAMHHLTQHMPEILAAIHFAITQGQAERACKICADCGTAWKEYGFRADGLAATEAALQLQSDFTQSYQRARAGALITLVRLIAETAEHHRKEAAIDEAIHLFQGCGDQRGVWLAQHQQAWQSLWKDSERAWQQHYALFESVQQANDQHWIALKLTDLAVLCNTRHNPEQAARYSAEAIRLFTALNDDANLSYALGIKASALLALGQPLVARKLWLLAVHHATDASPNRIASHESALGSPALWPDNPNEAIQHCARAVEMALKVGSPRIVYWSLVRQALAEIAADALDEAERHLSQAHAYCLKNNLASDAFLMRYYIGSAYLAARSNSFQEALDLLKHADELSQAHPNWREAADLQLIEATRQICKH